MRLTSVIAPLAWLALGGCREASSDAIELEPGERTERAQVRPPCEDCKVELPEARRGPVPMLVVLHGDKESAAKWFERWRGPALERGYGVLALQCPEALGCRDSCWYRWNGRPSWVTEQLEEVARQVPIDRARTFLVGWSGGATYIGIHAPTWHRTFAGIAIHGGGGPPKHGRCPTQAVPVYFLEGDGNRHHGAAKRFRTYFEDCGAEVHWELLEGADHDAEDKALDHRRAREILHWLDERRRGVRHQFTSYVL